MSGLGERGGSDGGDVADIDRAHPRVANGCRKHALFTDQARQGERALEVKIWAQEREPDAELADPPLDGCVIPQEPDRRCFVRTQLRELDQVLDARLRREFDEPFLLVLCALGRRRDRWARSTPASAAPTASGSSKSATIASTESPANCSRPAADRTIAPPALRAGTTTPPAACRCCRSLRSRVSSRSSSSSFGWCRWQPGMASARTAPCAARRSGLAHRGLSAGTHRTGRGYGSRRELPRAGRAGG